MTLAYHLVDTRFYPGITRVTPAAFARQLRYLQDNGFVSRLPTDAAPASLSATQPEICITFDDAYQCVHDQAFPLMESVRFRGAVFVIAGYVGKTNAWDVRLSRPVHHMGWSELKALAAAGWEIGCHSMTHAPLTMLSLRQLRTETKDSKSLLEDRLGCQVRAFSYPFGVLNQRVLMEVMHAGYEVAYGIFIPISLRLQSFTPFNRARTAVYLTDSLSSFASKAWAVQTPLRAFVDRVANFCSRGTILLRT